MGTIKVPKQSINLPFYHGTSEEALASGAGHLYGTSLPVGGKSTHSVITGHRGLVEALMFTRLDEVKEGDFFYIEVMGETLGYKVDRISVILPDDTSKLKIVPGEDRATFDDLYAIRREHAPTAYLRAPRGDSDAGPRAE